MVDRRFLHLLDTAELLHRLQDVARKGIVSDKKGSGTQAKSVPYLLLVEERAEVLLEVCSVDRPLSQQHPDLVVELLDRPGLRVLELAPAAEPR